MDRRALVLYLENVRDLEAAKQVCSKRYHSAENKYISAIRSRQKINPKRIPYDSAPEIDDTFARIGLGVGIFLLIYALVFTFVILPSAGNASETTFMFMSFWIICLIVLIPSLMHLSESRTAMRLYESGKASMMERIDKENEERVRQSEIKNRENIKYLSRLREKTDKSKRFFKEEYEKADSVLQSLYDMDIIPYEYRSFSGAEYLYDFMSSTQASYSDMLINAKLEEGIRRIENRLGIILETVQRGIYETRCMFEENRAQVERTIAQNKRMLESLRWGEHNAREAAQYASLAANYSKANAYFSLANYLALRG